MHFALSLFEDCSSYTTSAMSANNGNVGWAVLNNIKIKVLFTTFFVFLSVWLSISLSLVCIFVCPSVFQSNCLFTNLYSLLSVYKDLVYLPVFFFVFCLNLCLSNLLFVCLPDCPSDPWKLRQSIHTSVFRVKFYLTLTVSLFLYFISLHKNI